MFKKSAAREQLTLDCLSRGDSDSKHTPANKRRRLALKISPLWTHHCTVLTESDVMMIIMWKIIWKKTLKNMYKFDLRKLPCKFVKIRRIVAGRQLIYSEYVVWHLQKRQDDVDKKNSVSVEVQLLRMLAFRAGRLPLRNANGEAVGRHPSVSLLFLHNRLVVLTPLKNWFIYKWFVINLRLPVWKYIQSNLSWTWNQHRRVIFLSAQRNRSCVAVAGTLSLVTGSSFASLLDMQNYGRIQMKKHDAFSHQQDTIRTERLLCLFLS